MNLSLLSQNTTFVQLCAEHTVVLANCSDCHSELDLSVVPNLRTSHLRRLLQIQRDLRSTGRRLRLTGLSSPQRELFAVSGFDQCFTISSNQ